MADARAHRIMQPLFDRLVCDMIEFAEGLDEVEQQLAALVPPEARA